MGVHHCDYVLFGAKFAYDDWKACSSEDDYELFNSYDDNSYQDKITSCNGLTLVVDGMNGEYAYFGEVIAKAKDGEGIDGVSFDTETLQSFVGAKRVAIEKAIKKEAKKIGIELPPFEVGLHVFTHWH